MYKTGSTFVRWARSVYVSGLASRVLWILLVGILAGTKVQSQAVTALQPTKVTIDGGLIHVTFTNSGSLEVVAYSIKVDATGTVTTMFFPPAIPGILPGRSYEETLGQGRSSAQASGNIALYAVRAVLFRGGRSQGSADDLEQIDGRRFGEEYQLNRLIPLLEELSSSPDEKFRGTAQKCMDQSAAMKLNLTMPDGSEPTGPFKGGMGIAISDVARDCQEVADAASAGGVTRARQILGLRFAAHKAVLQSLHESRLIK